MWEAGWRLRVWILPHFHNKGRGWDNEPISTRMRLGMGGDADFKRGGGWSTFRGNRACGLGLEDRSECQESLEEQLFAAVHPRRSQRGCFWSPTKVSTMCLSPTTSPDIWNAVNTSRVQIQIHYSPSRLRCIHYNCCSTSDPLGGGRHYDHFPVQSTHGAPSSAAVSRKANSVFNKAERHAPIRDDLRPTEGKVCFHKGLAVNK